MRAAFISLWVTFAFVSISTAQPIAAKTSRLEVDWAKGLVALTGEWENAPPDGLAVVPPTGQSAPMQLKCVRGERKVALLGPASEILRMRVPGTRSILLAVPGESLQYRVDLPVMDLGRIDLAKVGAEDKFAELNLTASGALPGAKLSVAEWPDDAAAPGPAREVRFGGTAPLQLAAATPTDDPAVFRVRMPVRDEASAPLGLVFQLRNADGSYSRSVRIRLEGNALDKTIKTRTAARPAPVAEEIEAPTCLFLSAEKAVEACQKAGAIPVFYDPKSERELTVDECGERTVLKQGVAPGIALRKGEALLLAIDEPPSLELPSTFARSPGLEVDVEFGFAPIRKNPLLALKTSEGVPIAARAEGGTEPDDETRLRLTVENGVSLEPRRSAADEAFAGVLREVLQTVRTTETVNPLADAVRAAAATENAIVEAARRTDALPLEKVLDSLNEKLAVALDAGQRNAVLDAAKSEVAKSPIYALDRNRDGKLADDLALLLIQTLWKQGRYDPALHFQIVDGGGARVAVLPQKAIDPKWKKSEPKIEIENGAGKAIRIPKAAAVTQGASKPDLARVPKVSEAETVKAFALRLKALGLGFETVQQKVFSLDPVDSVEPEESKWVPLGTKVKVKVNRRTPKVIGMNVADAETELKKRDLILKGTVIKLKLDPGDEIVEQRPSEGEVAPANGTVYVRCKRKVPDVVGMPIRDALEKLRGEWFEANHFESLGLDDTVAEQYPGKDEAGKPELAMLRSEITLVLRRPIPKLTGLRYADAQSKMRQSGFRIENPEDFKAAGAEWVFQQEYAAGKSIRLHPGFDGKKLFFKLTPGTKVPPVLELSPTSAEAALKAVGLKAEYGKPEGPYWKVESQTPKSDGAVVELGSTVKLTLKETGKKVPRLVGLPFDRARADLDSLGFEKPIVDPVEKAGEVVFSQNPESDSVLDLKVAIKLKPGYRVPELIGQSLDGARAAVEAKGGTLGAVKEIAVETEIANEADKTEVVDQSPKPDDLAERGDAVSLTIKKWKYRDPSRDVPRFLDETEAKADELAGNFFELDKVDGGERVADKPSWIDSVRVTDQSPKPGEKAPPGSRIRIVLTKFIAPEEPQKPETVRVPDFKKMSPDEANRDWGGKLTLEWKWSQVPDAAKAGTSTIDSQSRRAGTEVPLLTPIQLTATQYDPPNDPKPRPKLVAVPNFQENGQSMTKTVWENALVYRKLSPKALPPTEEKTDDPEKLARKTAVIRSKPAPGTMVGPDTAVEYSYVIYVKLAKPVPNEIVCYGQGFTAEVDRNSTLRVNKCTISKDRQTITVEGLIYQKSTHAVQLAAKAIPRPKPTPVTLTGSRKDDAKIGGEDLFGFELSNKVRLQIPNDGIGDGTAYKSNQKNQAFDSTGANGLTVKFALSPPVEK